MKEKKRFYKLRNPVRSFVCALCGANREIGVRNYLTLKNYSQILSMTLVLTVLFYPWLEWRGIFMLPIIWVGFEFSIKLLFRKEIPCPHCGFDAAWYCKDVRVAKKKVEDFWKVDQLSEETLEEDQSEVP